MLERSELRRADIFSGSLISLIGGLTLIGASKMPMGGTYGGVDNPWYASPGAIPLLLGALFILLGLAVVVHGWRQGGGRHLGDGVRCFVRDHDRRRRTLKIGGLWLGLVAYVLLLAWKPFAVSSLVFGRVLSAQGHFGFLTEANGANYWISSAIFLTLFVWAFLPGGRVKILSWRSMALATTLWGGPLLLGYLFSVHLHVPLP